MTIRCLVLLTLAFLFVSPAFAQDPPAVEEEATEAPTAADLASETLLGQLPESVQASGQEWAEAWHAIPRLVSLQATSEPSQDLAEQLAEQLKLLGEKTFSNREWKSYWEKQATTADALTAALREANAAADLVDGIERWAELAKKKVPNQDKFFEALESQRDALEDRLEAALEEKGPGLDREQTGPEVTDPNPYERRSMILATLERRIEAQGLRRAVVASEVTFIEQQLTAEAILAEALDKDLELAVTELEIASSQANEDDVWGGLWTEIADASATKVERIRDEAVYGRARARSRQVELGLARSQITFRDGRIAELNTEYETEAALGTWFTATWETFLLWLRHQAWKIGIGLFLIYLGVRIALRLINRAKVYILEQADDDPDVDDDKDQRRQTLADVFASVTRIAIYIVGGLLALEQIGLNTGPILGSVAILGLAISFGSQNLVRDVVNGFFILLENQYAVGDVVTVNDATGTIERISIRSTWVRSATGDLHVVPNGSISLVSNLTRGWSKATCEIGVSYEADLGQVEEVINRVGGEMYAEEEWKEMLEEPPKWIGVTSLGDSAVVVRTQVKVTPGSQWAVTRELNRRLKLAFDAEGIEIPYPQTVIHQAN
ncbi:MAG: mechanosensitive ion channel family protein [Deltaproteobacteria bacterium]|nr:mechanosensitive ion channel family protein [Deltaproteobacteria bacterium]